MQIPSDPQKKEDLYDEVIEQCEKSQEDRRTSYDNLRQYYLYGTDKKDDEVVVNKIYPHLDTVTSFLYASETTKFSVHPTTGEPEPEDWRSGVFSEAINDRWHDSNTDIVVANSVLWALVYDSMILKIGRATKGKQFQINPYMVHPASFGVYREDVNQLDRQEAMVQTYYTTEDELNRRLKDHPKKDEILAALTPASQEEQKANTFEQISMGTWQPLDNMTPAEGNVSFNTSGEMGYVAEDMTKLRVLKELWIWDDELEDYRVVTRPEYGGVSIYDVKNPYLDGEHPFVKITPRPLPFYFWGESEVNGLKGLQRWRNEYIQQIRQLLKLQVKPPTAMFGMGPIEETTYAQFVEGSYITDAAGGGMPGAKMERFAPTLPTDLYRVVAEIDNAFNDYSGLPNTVQGKGEVGVRSGKQADSLARLGSARVRKRSLVIEDSLEKVAYLYARLMQKHDDTHYQDTEGNVFALSQFAKNYNVKVDAHSSSPIFVEDKRDLAFAMLDRKLITPDRAISMIDPPDSKQVLREYKKIEQVEGANAQAQQEEELKKEAMKHAPETFMQKLLARLFKIQ